MITIRQGLALLKKNGRQGAALGALLLCLGADALALGPLGGAVGLGLPAVPRLSELRELHPRASIDGFDGQLSAEALRALERLRANASAALLRAHRDTLELDPRGDLIRRHQLLAWSPTPTALAAALQLGLQVYERRELVALGEVVLVFSVPENLSTESALALLRAAAPGGEFDFNHLYSSSATAALLRDSAPASASGGGPVTIGLIDSGVAIDHPALRAVSIHRWGCGDKPVPAAHGTAVASLMVGQDGTFHGALKRAQLYAADVYCGAASGGAADQIAAALAWLDGAGVGVINLSLVGPPNRLLELSVAAMLRRGHILTAAVGNDGPNAPLLYPASYPGVVGVSAVDSRGRALPEAARGAQVMFAAPGSEMLAARFDSPGYQAVRGTSFAAPIVAALLAQQLPAPDPERARRALAALVHQAAGATGRRNESLGWGVLGESLRVAPVASN